MKNKKKTDSSKKNNKIIEYYKLTFKEILFKTFKNRILYIVGLLFILYLYTIFDSFVYSFSLIFKIFATVLAASKENIEFIYYKHGQSFFLLIFLICGCITFFGFLFYALTDKEIRSNIFNLKKIFQNILNIIIGFIFITLIILFTFVFTIDLFYEKTEFYKDEIKIYYTSWSKNNLFTVNSIKYKNIDFVNIDFKTQGSTRDSRIFDRIYLNLNLHIKNEVIQLLSEDIFYIETRKIDIMRIIDIFKSKNIFVKLGKQKKEVLELIKENYRYEYDQIRVTENLNEIFKLVE